MLDEKSEASLAFIEQTFKTVTGLNGQNETFPTSGAVAKKPNKEPIGQESHMVQEP